MSSLREPSQNNLALNKNVREVRTLKYCKMCRVELLSTSKELLEKKKKSKPKHQRIAEEQKLRKLEQSQRHGKLWMSWMCRGAQANMLDSDEESFMSARR